MNIVLNQFLGLNHSWSVVGQEISRAFIKQNHNVNLKSTNGYNNFPKDLLPYVKDNLDFSYDLALSYTCPKNFPLLLAKGNKKIGIWNYEFQTIPKSFIKYINSIDKFLPSSKWFYDICLENKVPADKMIMVPHGINWDNFENAIPLKLNTQKKYKFLINFGQPHLRKGLSQTLEAWGKAFIKKDDVCLVIKCVLKKPDQPFEVDFKDILNRFKKKYPNAGEILIISDFLDNIASLYKSCDALFMLTQAEAFFLPALEQLAAGGLVITSKYGGQLDFLNEENSILINGRVSRASLKAQYWEANTQAVWFEPDINEAVEKLRYVYNNMEELKKNKLNGINRLRTIYNWDNIAKQIIEITNERI